MKKFKAIIFDNDGTIIDSEPLHFKARQMVVERYDSYLTKSDYITYWMSRPTIIGVKHTLSNLLPDDQEKVVKEVLDEYHKLRDKELTLIPGFRKLINACADNFVFAVATVQPRESVERGLDQVLSSEELQLFKVVVSGEEVKNNKPAPDVWNVAMEHLKLSPSECIAVEDSVVGVTSAKAAGIFCIARASEWSSAGDLYGAGVDIVCRDYESLARLLV